MSRDIIKINGWTAVPLHGSENDYYIYDRRGVNDSGFRGLARSEAAARKWLEDDSGVTYANLPPIKRSEVECVRGEKIKTCEFPHHGWYRHDVYKVKGVEVGRIQTKYIRKLTTVTTIVGDRGVQGGDLRWMLEQAGYRLVEDN
jgi:hypothetical protein